MSPASGEPDAKTSASRPPRPSLAGVNTNLVVALHALLQERNVSRAAALVGLEQSSMSHALARLRAHFQDPLLVVDGRSMVPTRLARSLAGPVREAVHHLEAVFGGAGSFDPSTSRRTFLIASTDNLELIVLPRLSRILRSEAPGVQVRVFPLVENWRDALRSGELDLKLGRSYEPGPGLLRQDLLEERLVGVVRRGHPVRGRLSLERYTNLAHVRIATAPGLRDDAADLIDEQLAALGVERRVAVTVPHFLVAPFLVASTDLILTAPRRLIEAFRRSLGLRTVTPPLPRTSYSLAQVWSANRGDDPAQRWLRAAIQRSVRRL